MHQQGLLLLAIAVPNFVLANFILLRNIRNLTNLSFGGLALSAAFWALGLAAFIFSSSSGVSLWWAREYYTAAAFIAFFFLIFSIYFTGNLGKYQLKHLSLLLLPLLVVLGLILIPNQLIKGLAYHDWGKEVLLNKHGYFFYSIYFLSYVVGGFIIILSALSKATGLFKIYLKFLFMGLVVAFSLGATFNLFYPAFGNYRFIWVGPLFTVVYVSLVAYAIIRHRLFDIRTFVVRALAYVFTIFIASLLFVIPTLIVTSYLLNTHLSKDILAILALVTLATAMIFQNLKTHLNKITSRIFYRDYYDPQDVLDKISNLLVGSVNADQIEHESKLILERSLKPAHLKFLLVSDPDTDKSLLHVLSRSTLDIVSLDDLEPHKHMLLRDVLSRNDIAVAVRLKTPHKDLGFITLGYKQSGSIYSEADKALLDIVADEIAVGLQNALRFGEIQRFNETLQEKVEEATKKLRHANARLKELDQTKDEFISMASHQLRTPLTTIKGYLSMVLEGDVGPVSKDEKKMIQQAFDSAEHMVFLISDLLNVSRLQSGKFVIENKPTDLIKMVEAEVSQLQDTAKNHSLSLTFKKPEKFPVVNMDETKIRQVVMNFMDNAIYYTPSGGTIEVELAATASSIIYTVTDTGLGVPKAEQHHLFSKFYRAGNARKMRPDGTGLGLYMAKKVITAQGGAIIFKSTEGKGRTPYCRRIL
jgi:signal transduction histidine kinase